MRCKLIPATIGPVTPGAMEMVMDAVRSGETKRRSGTRGARQNNGTGTDRESPRLAVLIDGDNVSPEIVGGLFAVIATLGDATVRRIYGD